MTSRTEGADRPLSSATILVVDDDERNLLALSEVLSPIATVVTAASGSDALRKLLKQDFAVILLDVFMPDLDGYETAALIRQREQTARIPIIFLSAVNKETEHLVRGYEMGAVDYVFKPVDPLILKSKVSVFVDLYDMRRKLEESEQRQAAVLKTFPVALYVEEPEDAPRLPQYVAGDFHALTGFDLGEAAEIPDFFVERLHEDDRAAVGEALAKRLETGTMAVEYRWRCADGEYRHFFDQTVEIPPLDGRRRFAGTFVDVTERKRLEAQLVHSGKLDALGRLTGGVAHDFNNLLAAMLGGIHVLQKRITLGDREQRVINEMRHAAEQGTELVKRMMAFARQQDLTPTSITPSSLCDTVAGLVSHALGGTVEVDWECVGSPFNLFVDRGQLELALMNLIINARDAMPDGGKIRVSIEPTDRLPGVDRALCVRVRDQGVGIPSDLIARVTEPFFTTKETGKGTGLGLSMVAGFAQQSGGRLTIESTCGEGTTIDLILPATEAPQRMGESRAHAGPSWLSGKNVMLIDDDDSVRIVLAEQLRDLGAQVEDFATGERAIEQSRLQQQDYDLVLSDFAMPKLNGIDTLREIALTTPRAARILMTGFADDDRLTDGAAVPIIRKPIDLDRLEELLSQTGAVAA